MNFAIVDLECTSLKSDQGFLLCGGIKPLGRKAAVLGLKDIGACRDRLTVDAKLSVAIAERMESFDGWITWNGKMFDVPFLNDRLLLAGRKPLEKRFHIDVMYYARQGQSRLTSSRLDWVSRILNVSDRKTDLDLNRWKLAEAEAISRFRHGAVNYGYVVHHCGKDLAVTEQVYERLKPRIRNIHKG